MPLLKAVWQESLQKTPVLPLTFATKNCHKSQTWSDVANMQTFATNRRLRCSEKRGERSRGKTEAIAYASVLRPCSPIPNRENMQAVAAGGEKEAAVVLGFDHSE